MLEVELVNTDAGFRQLEDEWRELVCRCPDVPYFLTWEFVATRWKYFSTDRELWILTARDDDAKLVGLAPWAIARTSLGPFKLRRLEFLCRAEHPAAFFPSDGENLDFISLPGHKDAVALIFLRHLISSRKNWDVVDLGWLAPHSSLPTGLRKAGFRLFEQSSTSYLTTIPDDWATYERTVLGKKQTKNRKYYARRLERDYPGQVEYHLIDKRNEVGPAMDNLIEMNRRRWSSVGQPTPFGDERFVRFHREFAESVFDSGWLRFYQLRVGDHILAANCGIVRNDTYDSFQKGFDPNWEMYRPGRLLQAYELQQAIEEGSRVYDWAHGAKQSKVDWIDATREDSHVIAPNSWKGTLYLGTAAGLPAGKAIGRRVLPQPVYQWIKRAVVRMKGGD